MRIGFGYDVHQFSPDRQLWLGGIEVPCDRGLLGHSDADVAIHALCDALLGAAALGDIGLHFPDSDPKYKGIDSKVLLRKVVEMTAVNGYSIENVDITIALQEPKLRPYIDIMRETLAETMGIDIQQVSVKATTTERLGFVGRGEGCEVWATVLLTRKRTDNQ